MIRDDRRDVADLFLNRLFFKITSYLTKRLRYVKQLNETIRWIVVTLRFKKLLYHNLR